jgi:hypothetical protein
MAVGGSRDPPRKAGKSESWDPPGKAGGAVFSPRDGVRQFRTPRAALEFRYSVLVATSLSSRILPESHLRFSQTMTPTLSPRLGCMA